MLGNANCNLHVCFSLQLCLLSLNDIYKSANAQHFDNHILANPRPQLSGKECAAFFVPALSSDILDLLVQSTWSHSVSLMIWEVNSNNSFIENPTPQLLIARLVKADVRFVGAPIIIVLLELRFVVHLFSFWHYQGNHESHQPHHVYYVTEASEFFYPWVGPQRAKGTGQGHQKHQGHSCRWDGHYSSRHIAGLSHR